jgi:hypothetical protein
MYRSLMLFPASVEQESVRLVADEIANAFRTRDGFRAMSVSVGPLMGPGAHAGQFGSVVEVVFDSLENAFAAISAEDFAEVKAKAESFGGLIFLFEFHDL